MNYQDLFQSFKNNFKISSFRLLQLRLVFFFFFFFFFFFSFFGAGEGWNR